MTKFLVRLFVKNYQETNNPEVRQNYGRFAGIVGICTNLLLFVVKVIAGTLAHSISVTADAVNNLSDCAGWVQAGLKTG